MINDAFIIQFELTLQQQYLSEWVLSRIECLAARLPLHKLGARDASTFDIILQIMEIWEGFHNTGRWPIMVFERLGAKYDIHIL